MGEEAHRFNQVQEISVSIRAAGDVLNDSLVLRNPSRRTALLGVAAGGGTSHPHNTSVKWPWTDNEFSSSGSVKDAEHIIAASL